jgi:hypothetical protein
MADKKHCFGHMKLRKLLHDHGPLKEQASKWPIIGQFSSIGSLGASKENWLSVEFLQSLATVKGTSSVPLASVPLKLVCSLVYISFLSFRSRVFAVIFLYVVMMVISSSM